MKNKILTEGPFGLHMPGSLAKSLESLIKTLPKECRSLKRKSSLPDNTELVRGEKADVSLVSVESIDREGEVVVAKGVALDFFQRNPIVTFAHKYDELPVGRAQWIKAVPGGIKAKTVYTEATETARAIWQMTQEGILKGKSIGFIPTKMRPPAADEPQFKNAAAVIESSVLLEYAIAPVPVNQDALVEAVAKGYADADTLRKLGLPIPGGMASAKAPAIDDIDLLIKALEQVRIDPARIAQQILNKYANRGRV